MAQYTQVSSGTVTSSTVSTASSVGIQVQPNSTVTVQVDTLDKPLQVETGSTVTVQAATGSAVALTQPVAAASSGTVVVPSGTTVNVSGSGELGGAGKTEVTGATINLSGGGDVTGTSTAVVNLNSASTLNVGSGSLITGAGTVNVGTGSAVVVASGGGIIATNTINLTTATSTLTVASGGLLAGTGKITGSGTSGQVKINGTINPGNSPGAKEFSNAPGTQLNGTMVSEIDGATAATATKSGKGTYDQIIGTGSTTFAIGSSAVLTPQLRGITGEANNTYTPSIGQGFDIITTTTADGISGSFASVGGANTATNTVLAGIGGQWDVVYGSKAVTLYVTPDNLASVNGVSLTTNQKAVAAQLEKLRPTSGVRLTGTDSATINAAGSTGADKTAWDAILSNGDFQVVYDQLSGSTLASGATAAVSTGSQLNRAILARASNGRIVAQTGLADAQTGMSGGNTDRGWAAWVQPVGRIGSVDKGENGIGFDSQSYGSIQGLEARVNNWVVGASFGYVHDNLEFDNIGSAAGNETDVDNYNLSGYFGYQGGPLFFNGSLGYTWQSSESERNIALGSTTNSTNISRKATSETDGGAFSLGAELGYSLKPMGGFIIEPSVGLQYISVSRDGFTETGAGSLNLKVDDQDYDSIQSSLGVRVAKPMKLDSGVVLVPEARAAWVHELGDERADMTAAFASATANKFTVSGAESGSDSGILGVGVRAQLPSSFDLFADYTSQFNADQVDHSLSVGVKVKF